MVSVGLLSFVGKARARSPSGRAASPSLSVYATLRTPRSTSTTASPLSTTTPSSTPSSTSTPTSTRIYSPSLSSGFRSLSTSLSGPRLTATDRDGRAKRPSTTLDQPQTSTLRTNSAAISKHAASLRSAIFRPSGHDVDF